MGSRIVPAPQRIGKGDPIDRFVDGDVEQVRIGRCEPFFRADRRDEQTIGQRERPLPLCPAGPEFVPDIERERLVGSERVHALEDLAGHGLRVRLHVFAHDVVEALSQNAA